ncbi:MAG: ATP-binding protein [Elusimicrobia bacterium]|nr:ATP-binding protein [Elusimicrobiota bacterium]
MDRWEIRPSPNAEDPQRHLLLLKGGVADVAAVLKKFGALCGRPTPLDGDEYNLSFVLHKVTPEVSEKLNDWLGKMAPKPAPAPVTPPPPTPAPAPTPAPQAVIDSPKANQLPPMPAIPPIPTLAPASSAAPLQPSLEPPPPPLSGIPSASVLKPPTDILPPIPMPPGMTPPPPPPPAAMPPAKEPLISLGPEAAFTPPAPMSPPPAPAPAAVPPTEVRMATPAPAPTPAPAAAEAAGAAPVAVNPASTALTDELRPDWTFETLLVGAYNRFAHAAAMSVVTSPGSMYNPLFLYGVPGTGKSHLLYGIASNMSKGLGTSSLLVTSGARLSRAVSAAAASGTMAAIDKKVADSKAIFVDDIHLLAITDQNKDLLAKIFKSFFDRSQQVVITSMYPPKALGTLEEALKFTFSKGWSVDLKIPSPNVQRDLVAAVADRVGAQLSGDEIGQLADKLILWGYPDMSLWTRRIATLRKIRAAANQPSPLMDLLRIIYEPITIGSEAPPVSTAAATFSPPGAPAGAEPLAIVVPKGQQGLGEYAATLFLETGTKNGFTRPYRYAMMGTYDAMQQVGVPFQIADMCHRAGVTRALVVGPGADSPLAARANEFGHAVRRILDSSGVATGWVPHAQVHIAAHYVNAHLDFDR